MTYRQGRKEPPAPDLQKHIAALEVWSHLEWRIEKVRTVPLCTCCNRAYTDCEDTEHRDVIFGYHMKAEIDDITIAMIGDLSYNKGPEATWTWTPYLSRPEYICYDSKLTGGSEDDPVKCWKNLQPLLYQWKHHPEKIRLK